MRQKFNGGEPLISLTLVMVDWDTPVPHLDPLNSYTTSERFLFEPHSQVHARQMRDIHQLFFDNVILK